ncbi:MAG TPA: RNA-binding cell elongation regulator Jag/EloR [Acidimicrobiales bacterium]|nr:RNA-binding cell elongation regulator Jag/EloR [Acidimicrobiales bacterium]
MEWVEITAKTVEEAKELALDQLGVDADEAEFEVLEEPKAGLFGRVRGEARVRARVRPTAPRSKDGGRRRSRPERGGGGGRAEQGTATATAEAEAESAPRGGGRNGATDPAVAEAIAQVSAVGDAPASRSGGEGGARNRRRGGRGRSGRSGTGGSGERRPRRSDDEETRGEPVSVEALEQQGAVAVEFLKGLVDAFSLEATIAVRSVNESAVEVAVDGADLGLLVGPRGATLQAIQDLTRTVVLRETGMREGWVIVDVAEYRVKRRAALEKFALQVAEQVKSGGVAVRLDPMPPADRKVVHDALNGVAGIETGSEGEEPRRRVIVKPVAVG